MERKIAAMALGLLIALTGCTAMDSSGSAAGGTSGHHHKQGSHKASTTKTKPAPHYTVAQQQAIGAAQDYLNTQGFSRQGLIDQLTSKYGSQFKMADAVFAVNHIKVSWNAQAVKAAKDYLSTQHFSRQGLIQQLTSKYGSKFTLAQAVYAANHVGL